MVRGAGPAGDRGTPPDGGPERDVPAGVRAEAVVAIHLSQYTSSSSASPVCLCLGVLLLLLLLRVVDSFAPRPACGLGASNERNPG